LIINNYFSYYYFYYLLFNPFLYPYGRIYGCITNTDIMIENTATVNFVIEGTKKNKDDKYPVKLKI